MCLVFFALTELISRLLIDPLYFYVSNTYNEKKGLSISNVLNRESAHVDLLFIGTSRIPASIHPGLIKKMSQGKVVINAGRGYMMPGIHIQALQNKLNHHPNYLKGALVLLEYPQAPIYETPYKQDKLRVYEPVVDTDKPMPHLLIPHLTSRSLYTYLQESPNSLPVKGEMAMLYGISMYRTSQFINEKFNRLNKPLGTSTTKNLVDGGGIRNDRIAFAQEKAEFLAEQHRKEIAKNPQLSWNQMNNSSIAKLHEIIRANGGQLVLFEMPLHSIQKDIHTSEKAQANRMIFESWLAKNDIPIVSTRNFHYTDDDFPDTWHLAKNRRDDFTIELYQKLLSSQLIDE